MFELHPRLAEDTLPITDLDLCTVRLINDSRFPWVVLIPRRDRAVELHRLESSDQNLLVHESGRVAGVLERLFSAEKINLGALGNLVPQLHWHVVGRSRSDACWPGPVWGCGKALPYSAETGRARAVEIAEALR